MKFHLFLLKGGLSFNCVPKRSFSSEFFESAGNENGCLIFFLTAKKFIFLFSLRQLGSLCEAWRIKNEARKVMRKGRKMGNEGLYRFYDYQGILITKESKKDEDPFKKGMF